MKFKFRGVRGSIATPGQSTVKYGGNTTCIEIRSDSGHLFVFDAGTGIYTLGQELLTEMPVTVHIFVTHTHWDHIQGMPLFAPMFVPQNYLHIYGGMDPVTHEGIDRVLNVQLQYSYFPIREAELNAKVEYHTIQEGDVIEVGGARITPIQLSHPVLNFGYRIDCDGQSLFFTGDYEPLYNIYQSGDAQFEEYQQMITDKQDEITALLKDVDVLIMDSSYTSEEYKFKKGWGHGTYDFSIRQAVLANARKLFFTHHEPTRSDAELEEIFNQIVSQNKAKDCKLFLAREGVDFSIDDE